MMLRKLRHVNTALSVMRANFSARQKLAKLQQSSSVMLERQALGVKPNQQTHAKLETTTIAESEEVINLMPETEAAVMDNKGLFKEVDTEDPKIHNYIETEQSRQNDLQMINYKSIITDTFN